MGRRDLAKDVLARGLAGASCASALGAPAEGAAAAETNQSSSLASRLAKRDPGLLSNSVFNVPPRPQAFPEFLRGSWDVTLRNAASPHSSAGVHGSVAIDHKDWYEASTTARTCK